MAVDNGSGTGADESRRQLTENITLTRATLGRFLQITHIFCVAIGSLFAASVLFAQVAVAATPAAPASAPAATPSACEVKALSKDGKPLAGAVKTASIKKCEADAVAASGCSTKAVDKNGKALGGAAKGSFMKKCVADFQAGK